MWLAGYAHDAGDYVHHQVFRIHAIKLQGACMQLLSPLMGSYLGLWFDVEPLLMMSALMTSPCHTSYSLCCSMLAVCWRPY